MIWEDLTQLLTWQAAGAAGITALVIYATGKLRQFAQQHARLIIDAIYWTAERTASRPIRARINMKRYCINRLGSESTQSLQVPGYKGRSLNIDDVFVSLTLEVGGGDETFSHENMFEAGNRLIVVGDPGSGKSTLVKRVFRNSCREAQSHPRRSQLPIRLELKTLAPPDDLRDDIAAGEWLLNELRAGVSRVVGFEMGTFFDTCISGSGLLVLLDGLDEVASERYSGVAAALRGLSRVLDDQSDRNAILITMRTQFHQQVRRQFIEEYPQSLYVRPFLPSEIYLFLNLWPFDREKKKHVSRIFSELTDRPTLREMCSNPLVLAMYVQNYRESAVGELPETRTEFYRKVVTELLVTRRRRQDLGGGRAGSLREQREAIFGELAFENLTDPTQPANLFASTRAVALARRVWRCSADEAQKHIQQLASETGLISEEQPGETFRFIHLTFCEFLAAIYCTNRRKDGWQVLIGKHRDFVASGESMLQSRLVEVIPFALALLRPVERPEPLKVVANLGDRLVLGRCFLETQLYDRPQWPAYLQAERAHLAGGTSGDWDEDRLRRLHLFAVVVRDARDWSREIAGKSLETELSGVFADIVAGNEEVLVRVFSAYARQDAAAAFRLADQIGVDMLAQYPIVLVESCQEEPFLDLALERTRLGAPDRVKWMALLGEAALRYANVAERLNSIQSTAPSFPETPTLDPITRRAFTISGVANGSYYEHFLRHAVYEENKPLAGISLLHRSTILSIARAQVISWILAVAYFSIPLTVMSVWIYVLPDNKLVNFAGLVAMFLTFPAFGIPILRARSHIRHMCRAILNLDDFHWGSGVFERIAFRALRLNTTIAHLNYTLAKMTALRFGELGDGTNEEPPVRTAG